MSEIVERLRAAGKPMALDDKVWQTITVSSGASIFDEAASTITALQERVKELEKEVTAWRDCFKAAGFDGNSIVMSG